MGFEAGHAMWTHFSGVACAFWQINPIAGTSVDSPIQIRENPGNRSTQDKNNLVITVGVRGITVARSVRPCEWRESLIPVDLAQFSLSWRGGILPIGNP